MGGGWDTGLFDCFDDFSVALITYFCEPCQAAYNEAAVSDKECGCIHFCGALCAGPTHTIAVRGQIRQKYQIDGSVCGDVCTVAFCALCAVCQHTRQLDKKGASPAGFLMDGGKKKNKVEDK